MKTLRLHVSGTAFMLLFLLAVITTLAAMSNWQDAAAWSDIDPLRHQSQVQYLQASAKRGLIHAVLFGAGCVLLSILWWRQLPNNSRLWHLLGYLIGYVLAAINSLIFLFVLLFPKIPIGQN